MRNIKKHKKVEKCLTWQIICGERERRPRITLSGMRIPLQRNKIQRESIIGFLRQTSMNFNNCDFIFCCKPGFNPLHLCVTYNPLSYIGGWWMALSMHFKLPKWTDPVSVCLFTWMQRVEENRGGERLSTYWMDAWRSKCITVKTLWQ